MRLQFANLTVYNYFLATDPHEHTPTSLLQPSAEDLLNY